MALDQPQALTLTRAHWGRRAEELLGRIADSGRHMADWRDMVRSGAAILYGIGFGEDPFAGAMIWRIESDGSERVLVVCAMFCPPVPGIDVTRTTHELCQRVGREAGADYLRFWTKRPGLARKVEALGYDVSYVCERAVK